MKRIYTLSLSLSLMGILMYGCSKKLESSSGKSSPGTATTRTQLVPTPGGLIAVSNIHHVPKGDQLVLREGHVLRVHSGTGEVAEDFGGYQTSAGLSKTAGVSASASRPATANVSNPSFPTYPISTGSLGTLTYLTWEDTSRANPISNFSASWVVPDNPPSGNQVIYISTQMTEVNGGLCMAPVLDYGVNSPTAGYGSGGTWYIANWYMWNNGGSVSAAVSDFIQVQPGTNLQGVIQLLGKNADGTYNYSCSFAGFDNAITIAEGDSINGVPVTDGVIAQHAVNAALSAYTYDPELEQWGDGASYGEWPVNTDKVAMSDVSIQLTNGYPSYTSSGSKVYGVHWKSYTQSGGGTGSDGISSLAYDSSDEGHGQLNLYFWTPMISGGHEYYIGPAYPTDTVYVESVAGATVNVNLTVTGTGTGKLTILTPGITFSGGGTSMSVTNGSVTQNVTIPASGYAIKCLATYSGTSGSGEIKAY